MKTQLSIDIPEDIIVTLSKHKYIDSNVSNTKIALDYAFNKLIDNISNDITDECVYGKLSLYIQQIR